MGRMRGVTALCAAAVVVPMAFSGTAVAADPVIAAAGDIACAFDDPNYNFGEGIPGHCRQKATSDRLVAADLAAVLPLGDIQYDSASAADLNAVYNPTWGRLKSISHPVLGNHEGGGKDYFDYFNGAGKSNGPAGRRGKGWYSFDVGAWHIVALNSNCDRVGCTAGSEQEKWLRADLAAHPTKCTLAYWHHPRYSSGHDGSNTFMQPLWEALDEAGVEILLSGHSHNYERFAPLDRNGNVAPGEKGMRQFVVGTGGAFFTGGLDTLIPHSQRSQNNTFGALFLTLHATSYDWEFVPEAGGTFTDTGTTLCRDAPPPPPPPPPEPPAGEPIATPVPEPAVVPAPDRRRPVISNLRVVNGTTFRYTVSEKAVVSFRIRRCRQATRRTRATRACIRYSLLGTFTQRATAGHNARSYRGALRPRRLRPGHYRVDAVATDSAGNRSRTQTVRFEVRRPSLVASVVPSVASSWVQFCRLEPGE